MNIIDRLTDPIPADESVPVRVCKLMDEAALVIARMRNACKDVIRAQRSYEESNPSASIHPDPLTDAINDMEKALVEL